MIERLLNRDDYWGMLDQEYSSITLQLEEYRNVGIIVEGQFNSFLERIGDEIDGFRKKLSDHEANHGPVKNFEDSAWGMELDGLYAAYGNVQETFPAHVRAGLFLAVYGFVEHELLVLAGNYGLGSELSPEDLKGRGIRQSAVYFKKVMGIALADSILCGAKFKLVNRIRNALAHRHGYIAENDIDGLTEWRKQCELVEEVKIDAAGLVLLQEGFLPWFIKCAADTFDSLFPKLKDSIGAHFTQSEKQSK